MKKMIILTFILMTVSLSESLSLKDYIDIRSKKDKASNKTISLYIYGLGQGLFWANGELRNKYGINLYCEPDKLVLNSDNYVHILDDAIEKSKDSEFFKEYQDKDVLGLLLLEELQHVFPCHKK